MGKKKPGLASQNREKDREMAHSSLPEQGEKRERWPILASQNGRKERKRPILASQNREKKEEKAHPSLPEQEEKGGKDLFLASQNRRETGITLVGREALCAEVSPLKDSREAYTPWYTPLYSREAYTPGYTSGCVTGCTYQGIPQGVHRCTYQGIPQGVHRCC